MTLIRSLITCTAVAVCVLAFQFTAVAQNSKPNEALVSAVSGRTFYAPDGKNFVPLPVGALLHKGAVVKTGNSGHADLVITGVGVVQVTPNSTFGLVDLTITETASELVTDTQLELSEGAMFAQVNKLSKASRYEIKTPKAIAGVRGTTIYLTADGVLVVSDGTAGIAYPKDGTVKAFIVRDGQMMTPDDAAPHDAPPNILKEINDSVWDAVHHGIGRDVRPYVPTLEFFVSPIQPHQNTLGSGISTK